MSHCRTPYHKSIIDTLGEFESALYGISPDCLEIRYRRDSFLPRRERVARRLKIPTSCKNLKEPGRTGLGDHAPIDSINRPFLHIPTPFCVADPLLPSLGSLSASRSKLGSQHNGSAVCDLLRCGIWCPCNTKSNPRALGTALEWPEAKKKADQVRQWGIEVCKVEMP